MFAGIRNVWTQLRTDPVGYIANGWSAATRDYEVSIVPLVRLGDNPGDFTDVGLFVAELYELAENGLLKDQVAYKAWETNFKENNKRTEQRVEISESGEVTTQEIKVYPTEAQTIDALRQERPELAKSLLTEDLDTEDENSFIFKTSFELAVLPFTFKDGKRFIPDEIKSEISREFNARLKNGHALQYPVSKLTVEGAYLSQIKDAGLALRPGFSSCMHVTLNLSNPVKFQSKKEKLAHYGATWLALMLTGIAVLTITAVATYGVTGFLALAAATFWVKRSGNNFGLFDNVEMLLREVPAIFSKDFKWINGFTWRKALNATLKTAAVLTLATMAGYAVGASVMELALPAVATEALPALMLKALPALQATFAAFTGLTVFVTAFLGSLGPLRKERGLSPNDKTIIVSEDAADRLPEAYVLTNSKKARTALFDKLDERAQQEGVDLSQCDDQAKVYLIKRIVKGDGLMTALKRAEEKHFVTPRSAMH
ncbi:MAG: hypothetical protein U1E78_00180 [Gammaproteobacteria bacterium]